MRKFTLTFLTFLAVMPLLMCFMAFCPMQEAQAAEPTPCHEQSTENEEGSVMLISDCMGVDFFTQDLPNDFQFDQQADILDFVWADLTDIHSLAPQNNINGIRGPPPKQNIKSLSRPLYLTTQQFRI